MRLFQQDRGRGAKMKPCRSVRQPSRIQIQHVQPEIDCGRFPVKARSATRSRSTATIFGDGHDVLRAALRVRPPGARDAGARRRSSRSATTAGRRSSTADRLGPWEFTIVAWVDRFASWLDELDRKVAGRPGRPERASCRRARALFGGGADPRGGARPASTPALRDAARRNGARARRSCSIVERERARFGAWYELFPRSFGGFAGVAAGAAATRRARLRRRLPAARPSDRRDAPQGPQQRAERGRGRSRAARGRSAARGRPRRRPSRARHARRLRRLVERARGLGLELALDFAIQCSPDHPWLVEHPEWFHRRPDGTLKYAENPPKRYQDIHNVDFETEDWQALWDALQDVVLFWVAHGILAFRVDNPHTKPVPFWEWLIGEVQAVHPDVIFLAEAFTRPALMTTLAKVGFCQSYTYFTWRNTKAELEQFVERPDRGRPARDLPAEHLRRTRRTSSTSTSSRAGGRRSRPGSCSRRRSRRATASTRATRPARTCRCRGERGVPRLGEVRGQESAALDGPAAAAGRAAERDPAGESGAAAVRRRHDPRDGERARCLRSPSRRGRTRVIVVVNLDPGHAQEGAVVVPPELGLPDAFAVVDLLDDARYGWRVGPNYVRLEPGAAPGSPAAGGDLSASRRSASDAALRRELERVVSLDHPDPHHVLGAHPAGSGVVVRAFRPGAQAVAVVPARGKRVELAPIDPEGVFEGILPRRKLPLALPARGPRRGRNDRAPRRPVRIPADARRARPAPARGGPPRAPLRPARRPPARARRRRRHRVRGLGAERALGQRRRRLQRLGRPPPPDAVARRLGGLGALRPGRRAGQPLQVRAARARRGGCVLKADPYAFAAERPPATASLVPRPAPRLGGRRLARAAAGEAPARRAALDLRGAPRLVAAQPARGQPEPLLPRARRRARRLRRRPRLHPRRADAGDGAPVRGRRGATR